MSNYTIFNQEQIAKLVEPFMPGAAGYITPIMYKAHTPDIFMLLFRTTGVDGSDHYFISFEYDYIDNKERTGEIIYDWIGEKPIRAMPIAEPDEGEEQEFLVQIDESYKACLFLVPRPSKLGYWSDSIVIKQEHDINGLLGDFTDEEIEEVKGLLQEGGGARTLSVYRHGGNMEVFYND